MFFRVEFWTHPASKKDGPKYRDTLAGPSKINNQNATWEQSLRGNIETERAEHRALTTLTSPGVLDALEAGFGPHKAGRREGQNSSPESRHAALFVCPSKTAEDERVKSPSSGRCKAPEERRWLSSSSCAVAYDEEDPGGGEGGRVWFSLRSVLRNCIEVSRSLKSSFGMLWRFIDITFWM